MCGVVGSHQGVWRCNCVHASILCSYLPGPCSVEWVSPSGPSCICSCILDARLAHYHLHCCTWSHQAALLLCCCLVLPAEVQTIPSADLQTVDALWKAASNGKFGYSVQKEMWVQVRRTGLIWLCGVMGFCVLLASAGVCASDDCASDDCVHATCVKGFRVHCCHAGSKWHVRMLISTAGSQHATFQHGTQPSVVTHNGTTRQVACTASLRLLCLYRHSLTAADVFTMIAAAVARRLVAGGPSFSRPLPGCRVRTTCTSSGPQSSTTAMRQSRATCPSPTHCAAHSCSRQLWSTQPSTRQRAHRAVL